MTKLTTQEVEKLQNQILELKLKHPLSERDKLKLQKLQQKLIRE
mgnify:FL=1|tara:strand:+ start:586 stop:717 length:132 start_codon:yes stop_codon:yes gene_type:complete